MSQSRPAARAPVLSAAEISALLDREFPQLQGGQEPTFVVEAVGSMTARMRLVYHDRHLRPGGTLSGVALFTLADVALYVAVLAQLGAVTLAVTSNLTINFLRKPARRDLIGECRLLKLGKRLAVGEVSMFSQGDDAMVAHATGTYAIPAGPRD